MALNIEGTKAALHLTYGSGTFQVASRSCPTDGLQGRSYPYKKFGEWIFVTVSADFKNNTLKFYVNGEEITSTLGNGDVNYSSEAFARSENAQASTIGGDPTTAYYNQSFGGIMDEWKIYNRAITNEEAKYIYINYGVVAPREADQKNYDILDNLSNDTAIFAVGMNEAIYQNKRNRLDWNNINAVPYIFGDTLMLPAKFLTDTYGAQISWEEEGKKGTLKYQGTKISFNTESNVYVVNGNPNTLSVAPQYEEGTLYLPFRFVFESFGKYVYYNENGLVAAGDKALINEKFSDEAYVNWTKYALCELPYKQPTSNHSESRVLITHSDMAGGSNLCYASPSIAKLPDGTLIASHDAYVYGGSSAGAYVYRSEDKGKTWKHTADLTTMMGNVFELNGDLYLMGVQKGNAVITIQKSTDGGYTWTEATDSTTGLIESDKVIHAHCAPTPVVVANGRVYRAYESVNSEGWTRGYCAVMASASVNSDLLNASSWTITDPVQLDLSTIPEGVTTHVPGWLEGNAVLGPNGEILNIIRVNFEPDFGYAAVLKLSKDNKTLTFDRFIDFDGGMTKFVVRRDEKTGKYISLVNNITNIDYAKQRTVLSLAVSDDAYNWEIKETLLYPNVLDNWENIILERAYQYVDWIIDGDDILYVVREAGDGAPNYHDALDITFYRLENFRQYLN